MLISQTLFDKVDKVADAIKLLRENEPPEGYYLCFSGGKDSVVTYDLAVKAGVKFDAHHNITTVEPPELMRFIRDYNRQHRVQQRARIDGRPYTNNHGVRKQALRAEVEKDKAVDRRGKEKCIEQREFG